MSDVGDAFRDALGEPAPSEPHGMPFDGSNTEGRGWQLFMDEGEIGAGFYLNRFLYLFGEQLPKLQPCLKAWSFLLPKDMELYVIGKNAYGALLILEDPNGKGGLRKVGLLDPTMAEYWTEPDLAFSNLLGWWLPNKKLPNFFKTELYDAWAANSKEPMEADEILGMTIPIPLGGTWKPDNFVYQNIVEYYEGTAAAIRKAAEATKKPSTKPSKKGKP